MDGTLVSTFAALAGSIIGGLATGGTSWLGYRTQTRAGHRLHAVTQRELLYRDFVVAGTNAYGNAIVTNEPDIEAIVALYGLIGRMRMLSTVRVVECAERAVTIIVDEYSLPTKSIREIRDLIAIGEAVDPLREFSEVTRDELRLL